MPRTWVILIVLALTSLVVMTGYQLYLSITGQNEYRQYNVDTIEADLGEDVLLFLDEKGTNIQKGYDQI